LQSPTKVVGRRVAAFIIDFLIFAAVVAVSWFALTKQVPGRCASTGGGFNIGDHCRGFPPGESGRQAAWFAIWILAAFVIWVILPGLRGTSPGHAALGLRIVNGEGQTPGFWRGLARGFFLWLIDVSIIGLVVALVTQRNQRVGDLVGGTFVVDKNFAGAIPGAQPAAVPAGGGYGPPPSGTPSAAAPPPQQGGQPADWYPDPQGQARLRYWDGQRWTDHTSA
jgi:uncharacterized RDD family membrane protein YckC